MKISSLWIQRVRLWWTAGFTLLLLLNLDQFGFASGLGPAPKYWSVGVFLGTFFLFLPGLKPSHEFGQSLVGWSLGYLLLSVLWIGVADNLEAAGAGLVFVVTTCLFVGAGVLAYPRVAQSARLWRLTLWVALLLAVASILQEYLNPAAYVFADAGQGIPGRAAGLYLNPNTASQTLVMLLACLMLAGTPTTNLMASLVALPGLFLTFSRGGLIAWAVLVVAATVYGRLPRWFLGIICVAAASVLLAGPMVLDALSAWVAPENRNSLDRLAWLLGQGSLSDASAGEREHVATYAWQQFLDAPLLGHGLGSMWGWGANVGTHNLILRHLVEYGMLGLLILPLFLLASIRTSPNRAQRGWLWIVGGLVLLLSLFTHNMLEQATFLLPWLALCLMPAAPGASALRRRPA